MDLLEPSYSLEANALSTLLIAERKRAEAAEAQLSAALDRIARAHTSLSHGSWAPEGLVQRALDILTPAPSPGAGEKT